MVEKVKIEILYVEDEEMIRSSINEMLRRRVETYYVAQNGQEGLELYQKHQPDLVITDIKMPVMNGLEMIREINKIDSEANVVITSAHSEANFFMSAIELGVSNFLLKPIDKRKLFRIIQKFADEKFLKMQLAKQEKEKKLAQDALKASEEKFRTITSSANDAILMVNKEDEITYWNPAAERMFEFSSEEIYGENFVDKIVHDDLKHKMQKGLRILSEELHKSSGGDTIEIIGKKKSGVLFPVEFSLSTVELDGKNDVVIVIRDRTEQKMMEKKLSKSEAKYRKVINLTSQGFGITKLHQGFVEVNDALCQMLGYDKDELLGKHPFDFVTPDVDGEIKKQIHLNDKENHHRNFDIKFLTRNNEEKYVNITSSDLLDDEGYVIGEFSFYNDITKQKNAEEKIKKLYQSLMQELDVASSAQSFMLPQWLMLENNLIVSSNYTPSSKVGGDLFDFIKIDDTRYVAYVGDVSGHGVQAALLMTAVKSTINMIVENQKDELKPHYIMNRLNKILTEKLLFKNYMTMILGIIDTEEEEIRYFNAGHPPVIQYNIQDNKATLAVEKGSIPIGWETEIEYKEEEEDVLPINDKIITFFYTDGIFECQNKKNNELGLKGFVDFLETNIEYDNFAIIPHKIKKRLIDLNYDITLDDFTLLAFKKNVADRDKSEKKLFLMGSMLINTGKIGAQCEKMVKEYYDDDKFATEVELVVNEFLNNVIIHALSNKPDTIILLQIEINKNVNLTVWDKGIPWEVPEKKNNEMVEEVDNLSEHGRGIPIIYALATSLKRIRYDEINETTIVLERGEKE
ncbi:MAG: PAS domain S-box protein [Candidatus Cloacimonadota bacterium]|nr:PAS domain S-box protein [Candidatus Cloacimonadota bacterium]